MLRDAVVNYSKSQIERDPAGIYRPLSWIVPETKDSKHVQPTYVQHNTPRQQRGAAHSCSVTSPTMKNLKKKRFLPTNIQILI